MQQEKYELLWHTYSDHLREMLHELQTSEELVDIRLVCDDKRILKAHKIVLSACSTFFKSIFNNHSLNSSVIYLRGIKHQEMQHILQYMYTGVATFHSEGLNEFLSVAKELDIKEINKHGDLSEYKVDNDAQQKSDYENEHEDAYLGKDQDHKSFKICGDKMNEKSPCNIGLSVKTVFIICSCFFGDHTLS